MSSKTTKAGRRGSFRYHIAQKWAIRGQCEGAFLLGGALAPIPQYAPRGWRARAWSRDGARLHVDVILSGAFLSIPYAPAVEAVTYELTARR